MDPFDSIFDQDGDQEAAFFHRLRQQTRLASRLERERRKAMRDRQQQAVSSDEEGPAMPPPIPNGATPIDPDNPNQPEPELVKLDPADVGMKVGLKHFYSGKEDKRGRFQWQTTMPVDLGKPAEDAESETWAIIQRNVKVYNDPKRVLGVHSIVIQSPLLKETLKDVLVDYPGVTVGLKRLEFNGRFEPLIHRWDQLNAAIDKLKEALPADDADDESKGKAKLRLEHAGLLKGLLEKEFAETLEGSRDLKAQKVTTYDLMWTLFQPGQYVYNQQQRQDRVMKLHSSRYGQDRDGNPVFWLTCSFVDYDGTRFGTNKLNIPIASFDGTRSITNLPSFPLEFHTSKTELKTKLIERGSKIEELAGVHFRAYQGVGYRMNLQGQRETYSVNGRIVIDAKGWTRFNPNFPVIVSSLNTKDTTDAGGFAPPPPAGDYPPPNDYDGGYDNDGGMPIDGYFADEDEEAANKKVVLTDEQKLITNPLVRGYALKEKMWLNFFVNFVHDVTFNEDAFDSLVLPKSQKELILGFTATQQDYRLQFDDVIAGKGKGIILLLCGSPGVGKTLTAESVAEEMKVPLFMMSAGDLGLDSRHIEARLQGVLDMCTRWNAILLLDEADIFLEERNLHELERNKLVSIFLRVLEYFEGIMFLTTNRVNTFDPAFQSRIHISINYPELDSKSRKTVWQNFLAKHDAAQALAREKAPLPLGSAAKPSKDSKLASVNGTEATSEEKEKAAKELHEKRTQPHVVTPQQISELAKLSLNGRIIKNTLKTSQLLASKRGEALSYEHVKTVMEVTQHLNNESAESARSKASIFN